LGGQNATSCERGKAGVIKTSINFNRVSYHEYLNSGTLTDIDFILNLFDPDRNKAIIRFKQSHKEFSNRKTYWFKQACDNKGLADIGKCYEVEIVMPLSGGIGHGGK